MSYSNFPLFSNIPAVYAFLPHKSQKRRTATNIMAGSFDPLPMLTPDFARDDASSSCVSSMVAMEQEERLRTAVHAGPRRAGLKKGKGAVVKKGRRGALLGGVAEGTAKEERRKRAIPEEKENAMSDSEPGGSLSPAPSSPIHVDPAPAAILQTQPKASGFWRARSSNASNSPVPSAVKRKQSSLLPEDKPASSSSDPHPSKKPRFLPPDADPNQHVSNITSPSVESSPSLSSLNSESADQTSSVQEDERLTRAAALHIREGGATGAYRCEFCALLSDSDQNVLQHIKNVHHEQIAQYAQDNPIMAPSKYIPQKKPRARKNVAVKKGWKGWVEEDLEPQKLILLDKPEVLPERTTRSGRKID